MEKLLDPEFWSLTGVAWYFLLIIFVAKAIEVTLTTLRIILVNRGFRTLGTALALVEITLWVFVAGNVISDLNAIKGAMYAFGFATGVYTGSLLESKLAFGKVLVQIITREEESHDVIDYVRSKQIGVTTMEGEGYESKKKILLVYVERNQTTELLHNIRLLDSKAVIGISDVHTLTGGYLPKRNKKVLK